MSWTRDADVRLAGVAVAQAGAFTRAQARGAGFTAAQIERRARSGSWVRVLPGVFHHATTPASPDLAQWAAVLWAGPDCALSHTSAAAVWRLVPVGSDRPELIVPRTRAPRARGVLVHRVARIADADVLELRGLPVTAPVRTVIDLAGVLGERELAAVVERARSRGLLTIGAVRARLHEIGSAGRPGAARLRALLSTFGSGQGGASATMAG